MPQNFFKETEKNNECKPQKRTVTLACAGCGADNPEYLLDDRQLCVDCYKSEVEH
ncbi:MAG: hypothetical protein NWE93_02595 [Candidatus Bathyarchaeota archaeon]|nr:hypothetical protein [Candidatus Bathyarchaeota archaeon]